MREVTKDMLRELVQGDQVAWSKPLINIDVKVKNLILKRNFKI